MLTGHRLRAALTALLLASAALFAIGVAKERHDIKQEQTRAHTDTAVSPAKTNTAGQPTNTTVSTTSQESTAPPESSTVSAAKTEAGAEHAAERSATTASTPRESGSGESAAKRQSEATGTRPVTVNSQTGESAATLASEHGGESAAHLRAERSNEQIFGINTESIPLVVGAVAVSVLLAIALWLAPGSSGLLLAVLGLGLVFAVFDVREAAHQASENRSALEAIAIVVASLHLAAVALAAVLLAKSPLRRPATV